MNKNENTNERQWMLLILLLKEIAIQKYGTGWQTHIVNETKFSQSNVSRMFSLKFSPSLKNLLIITKAIKINLSFKSNDSKSDLNLAFEKAIKSLEMRNFKTKKN